MKKAKTVKAFADIGVVVGTKFIAKPNTSAVRLQEECEFDCTWSRDTTDNNREQELAHFSTDGQRPL